MPTKYAYVAVMTRGDQYIIGAITLAYSLRMHNTKYDILCITTPDVPRSCHKLLESVYTRVIDVSYIIYQVYDKDVQSTTVYRYFDQLTKLHIMNFTEYEKVLMIDSDMIVLENIDHIFDLNTPAFNIIITEFKNISNEIYKTGNKIKYQDFKVDLNRELCSFHGAIFLLAPNEKDYNDILKLCQLLQPIRSIDSFLGRLSPEEFILFCFYALYKKSVITIIGTEYNTYSHYMNLYLRVTKKLPRIIHYIDKKPWFFDSFAYYDIIIWWNVYYNFTKVTDEEIVKRVNDIKLKLIHVDGDNKYPTIITEGNLLPLFTKSNYRNMRCLLCSYLKKFLSNIHDDHILAHCKYLNVTKH